MNRRDAYRPTSIGHYQVLGVLGSGAMGVVYHAYDEALCKEVAIKVMRAPVDNGNVAMLDQRFAAEVAAVNRINHPNIVNIFGFARLADGRPYYVMEFLRGLSLGQLLDAEPVLGHERIVGWMRSVADAIACGHSKQIVHRDLKPDNIFLTETGHGRHMVKVLDFGVAKLLENPRMTATGVRVGTPLYMAPEQYLGGAVDHRADIYALGAIYFRGLAGREHCPTTIRELASFHRSRRLPNPPSCYGVPASLDQPILRCLAKSPGDRYGSILEAQEAIERAVAAATTVPFEVRSPLAPRPAVGVAAVDDAARTTPLMRFSRIARYRGASSRKALLAVGAIAAMLALVLVVALATPGRSSRRAGAGAAPAAAPAPAEPGLTLTVAPEAAEAARREIDTSPAKIQRALMSNGKLLECMTMAPNREMPQLRGVGFDEAGRPTIDLRGGDAGLRACIQRAFREVAATALAERG